MALTITRDCLASDAARRLAAAACDHARAEGWQVAVCIVDAQGAVLASLRMDGAMPAILGYAADKAFTAVTMRRPTEAVADHFNSSARMRLGATGRDRLLVWGGGLPIRRGGAVIGAIGVSGAEEDEDIACACAALAALGLLDEGAASPA